jgi:hypothetical protein
MTTGDPGPTTLRPIGGEADAESPPTLGLPFAPPSAAVEPAVPAAAVPDVRVQADATPAALETPETAAEPSDEARNDGPFQIEAAQPGEEPEESPLGPDASEEAAPAEPPTVEMTAPAAPAPTIVQAGSDDDLLSMFREASSGGEFQELTKEMENVSAQELLTEARAVRDLLGVPEGAGELAA